MDKKPYINYKFTGLKSMSDFLDEAGIENQIIENPGTEKLKMERADLFSHEKDRIILGRSSRDGISLYYLEFRMVLEESMFTHLSFIFNHQPEYSEMLEAARDFEAAVLTRLSSVKSDMESKIN